MVHLSTPHYPLPHFLLHIFIPSNSYKYLVPLLTKWFVPFISSTAYCPQFPQRPISGYLCKWLHICTPTFHINILSPLFNKMVCPPFPQKSMYTPPQTHILDDCLMIPPPISYKYLAPYFFESLTSLPPAKNILKIRVHPFWMLLAPSLHFYIKLFIQIWFLIISTSVNRFVALENLLNAWNVPNCISFIHFEVTEREQRTGAWWDQQWCCLIMSLSTFWRKCLDVSLSRWLWRESMCSTRSGQYQERERELSFAAAM